MWEAVRKQFPLDEDLIYMNNGGLGPSPYPVIQTLKASVAELERISESGHHHVDAVRKKACRFFHCHEDELALTRNTTEGMNIIARGIPLQPGDEILISTHEHPGGAMPWFAVARDKGASIKLFEPGSGGVDTLEKIASAMTPQTRVVSISHITCTTGLVVPAREIAGMCRGRGIISVFDGAQSAGMIPVDLHAMGCDFYATSGHKWMLGPKGTGVLYIRKEMLDHWQPTHVGAYSDKVFDIDNLKMEYIRAARCTEYGTRNTPVIQALGAAFDFLSTLGMQNVAKRSQALATYFKTRLFELDAFKILTPLDKPSSAAIVTFKPIKSRLDYHHWVQALITDHKIRLRPVDEHGLNAIRVSTHVYNSPHEIDALISALSTVQSK